MGDWQQARDEWQRQVEAARIENQASYLRPVSAPPEPNPEWQQIVDGGLTYAQRQKRADLSTWSIAETQQWIGHVARNRDYYLEQYKRMGGGVH